MTDAAATVDIDHLRGWVGREQVSHEPIALFPSLAMAGLLDRAVRPQVGDALPLPWHWLHFLEAPALADIDEDGHPKRGGFLPPVPLPRRMWAAGRLCVTAPMVIGAPAQRRSTIESVELKDGKTGRLVFVNVRHVLTQGGRSCVDELQNIVYRAAASAAVPLPAGEPAPAGDFERTLVPNGNLLMRFSALTYNGHRIHYDRDYAVQQEFHAGLVVHGPLLACLLLDLLSQACPAQVVRSFSFRAQRPVFDGRALTLAGRLVDGGAELWTRDAEGCVAMKAAVEFA